MGQLSGPGLPLTAARAGFSLPMLAPCQPVSRRDQEKCRDFNDNDRPMCQMYTVQSGDTITTIAQRYKVGAAYGEAAHPSGRGGAACRQSIAWAGQPVVSMGKPD